MSFYITKTYCSQQNFYSQSWGVRKSKCFLIYDSIFLQIRMISLTKIDLLYTIKNFVIEQRQININREKEKVMTITKNVLNLMIFFLTYKRSLAKSANSQQPTANSQQPTANSQQPTANSQQPTANSQQPTANSQQLY